MVAASTTAAAVALLLATISIGLQLRKWSPPTVVDMAASGPPAEPAAAEMIELLQQQPAPVPGNVDEEVNSNPFEGLGQSIGTPRRGWLSRGRKLETGDGYVIRHPQRVWATDSTIEHVLAAIDTVREAVPRIHRLGFGDLSGEFGGVLQGHLSHQSGRDVDLGLYYRSLPRDYPERFVPGTVDNLHNQATWTLLEALAGTADLEDGVQWILLDYRIQRQLYHWAQRHGVDQALLDRAFQYPHGPDALTGIIRHFPGHDDHVHVRFRCPTGDPHCQDPDPTEPGPSHLPP